MALQYSSLRMLALCGGLLAATLTATRATAQVVIQTNLVTDDQSVNAAQTTDPNLVNPWGISYSPTSPFWVSDNGKGLATLYKVNPTTNATVKQALEVTIPGDGTPTGQAFNTSNASGAFNKDLFLFVSEDGTISGWNGGTLALILQSPSPDNVYKGTALDVTGGHAYLLSANFHTGNIDVLKGDAFAPDLTGKFTDPNLPAGYAPFNVQVLNGKIYVTYALQNGNDDLPGPGHGIVNAFDLNGNLLGRIGTMGVLNSPWGLAIAPSSFGSLAGDLLVGNFGDGTINVFNANPATPGFLGTLRRPGNSPLMIDGLWGLIPGNGGNGGSTDDLYFSAGPVRESHGLFGVLSFSTPTSVPEPGALVLLSAAMSPILLLLRRRRPKR